MASIVTYDIPSKHVELKKEMFALGYTDQITGTSCDIIYLPNTTLHHESKIPEEARKDVQAICKKLGVKLERCISTIWSGWSAICDEPFKQ